FGDRLLARLDEAAHGGLTATDGAWQQAVLFNPTTWQGTQRANYVQPGQAEYRQITKTEVLLIDRMADEFAKEQGIDGDTARQRLTQQALRMIDADWAS